MFGAIALVMTPKIAINLWAQVDLYNLNHTEILAFQSYRKYITTTLKPLFVPNQYVDKDLARYSNVQMLRNQQRSASQKL